MATVNNPIQKSKTIFILIPILINFEQISHFQINFWSGKLEENKRIRFKVGKINQVF